MSQITERQALQYLFEDEDHDLTASGYLGAISGLRARSRAVAMKVERALRERLDELFPRRRIRWYETSIGTRYRVSLLSGNPLFRADVAEVRRALGILGGDLVAVVSQKVPAALVSLEDEGLLAYPARVIAHRDLAQRWIRRHQRAYLGLPPDDLSEGLGVVTLESAEHAAQLDLGTVEHHWLRAEPKVHWRCVHEDTPYHRAVAKLVERHRLPTHVCGRVQIYVLTMQTEDLVGLEPLGVSTASGCGEIQVVQQSNTFAVAVSGIDEFVTRKEWDEVWERYVRPRQEELWYQRGQGPTGRLAPDLKRLREGLPLYAVRLTVSTVEEALSVLQRDGSRLGEMNAPTAGRLINDLDDLFKPLP